MCNTSQCATCIGRGVRRGAQAICCFCRPVVVRRLLGLSRARATRLCRPLLTKNMSTIRGAQTPLLHFGATFLICSLRTSTHAIRSHYRRPTLCSSLTCQLALSSSAPFISLLWLHRSCPNTVLSLSTSFPSRALSSLLVSISRFLRSPTTLIDRIRISSHRPQALPPQTVFLPAHSSSFYLLRYLLHSRFCLRYCGLSHSWCSTYLFVFVILLLLSLQSYCSVISALDLPDPTSNWHTTHRHYTQAYIKSLLQTSFFSPLKALKTPSSLVISQLPCILSLSTSYLLIQGYAHRHHSSGIPKHTVARD